MHAAILVTSSSSSSSSGSTDTNRIVPAAMSPSYTTALYHAAAPESALLKRKDLGSESEHATVHLGSELQEINLLGRSTLIQTQVRSMHDLNDLVGVS